MKYGKGALFTLALIFIITEVTYAVVVIGGEWHEALEYFIKLILILPFVYLFSRGLKWAKWVLSVLLILSGIAFLILGGEDENVLVSAFGLYHLFFGVSIHFIESWNAPQVTQNSNELEGVSISQVQINSSIKEQPTIVARYVAWMIDIFFIGTINMLPMLFLEGSPFERDVKWILLVMTGVVYVPVFTAFSGTLGQFLMRFRVRRYGQPEKRIGLFRSFLRWILKLSLGVISFLTVPIHAEHRAIHDLICDTEVVRK